MGSFNYRCAASGLPIRAGSAIAIWVCEVEPGKWVPAALPLRGRSNFYGTIERIDREGFNFDRLKKWFNVGFQTDRIRMTGDSAYTWKTKAERFSLDGEVNAIERATSYEFGTVTFSGKKLAQRLFHAAVFDAIVAAHPDDVGELAVATTLPCPAGAWFYQSMGEAERAEAQTAFAAVRSLSRWFSAWMPDREPGQDSVIDTVTAYVAARERFADCEWMRAALDVVAAEEEDIYPLPDRWIRDWGRSWYGIVVGSDHEVAIRRSDLVARVEQTLEYKDEDLLTAIIEVFAVVRGEPQPAIDLRPFVRFEDNATHAIAALTDGAACEELLTAPHADLVTRIDPHAFDALPELAAPLAPVGSEALYLVRNGLPAWAPDERDWVFEFATVDDNAIPSGGE